jgi:hypothetical protein
VIDWQTPTVPSTPLYAEAFVTSVTGSTRSNASGVITFGKENTKVEITRAARVAKRSLTGGALSANARKARREFSITAASVTNLS